MIQTSLTGGTCFFQYCEIYFSLQRRLFLFVLESKEIINSSGSFDIISKQKIKAKEKDLIEKWIVDLDQNHSTDLPHSFQWLEEMNGFLPCCPFDCQSLMDSEIPIDDFLQMGNDFLDIENEMNLSTEGIDDNRQEISDYNLTTLSSAECTKSIKSTSDVTSDDSEKFNLDEPLEKSILTLSASPLTSLEDPNNKTNMIITTSEAPSQFSSVSKAFQIAIFESSDNIETLHDSNNIESFQDLNALLNKEYCSVSTCTSKEILHVDSSDNNALRITESNPAESISATHHSSESESTSSSGILLDGSNDYEPQNKRAKTTDCASTSKSEKYYEMRRKNNISSRRSRQTKKQREKELEEKEKQLIKENESLRKQEKELELLVQKVKDILFNSVKKKT
ncbi:uncharacterized protein [Centruroides vittatus]|uniref:uncharacterized protein n=1 Tax=Centruroides vittatus TaxID=120091 RepID=UPI00351074F2